MIAPRTKLARPEGKPTSSESLCGFAPSLVIVTLSIIVIDLIRLRKRVCRAALGVKGNRRSTIYEGCDEVRRSVSGQGRGAPGPARLWLEINDLALIIMAVASWKGGSASSVKRKIVILAHAKRGTQRSLSLRIALFIVLCVSGSRVAYAEPAKVLTPIEMFEPENATGVRISPGFVLLPEASTDVVYDDNIFNADTGETQDTYLSVRPALTVRSDFSRHAFRLEGRTELRRYFGNSDENSNQWSLLATGLLDLGEGIDVESFGGIRRGIEGRGTLGDVFLTDAPVAFTEKQAGITVSRPDRRLGLSGAVGLLRRDYSDTTVNGAAVDLSLRDVTIRTARFRGDLRVTERSRIFAEVSGNQIEFQNPAAIRLDSSGVSVLTGITYELTSLLDVEAAVGYIHQDFDSPLVASANELNYRLAATWTPRPEWRFTGSAARVVDASRSQESPAIITNDFRLGAERALGDRLLVRAELAYQEDDYRGTARLDQRYVVSASSIYRLSEQVSLSARASYRDQDGGTFGRSFKGVSALIGVRAVW